MIKQREINLPEHVLVVEDEELWMDTYKRSLERRGIQVSTTSSVEEALELLGKRKFNRIIIDGLYGEWLRIAQAAQEKGLPVKLISGNLLYRDKAKRLGIEFIDKGNVSKILDQI